MSLQYLKTKGFACFILFSVSTFSLVTWEVGNFVSWEMIPPRHIPWFGPNCPLGASESTGTIRCPDVGLVVSEAEKINVSTKSVKSRKKNELNS